MGQFTLYESMEDMLKKTAYNLEYDEERMNMAFFRRVLTQSSMTNRNLKPSRIITLSFIAIIMVGTILLALPVSSREGYATDLLTAIFTATSAACVTGLSLVDTYEYWSLFGQSVLLVLIQIGGLGFMSFISIFYFLLNRRVRLRERLVIMESMNLNSIEGVIGLVRHVLLGTLLFESVGAVILSCCFIPEFGIAGGIWRGIFHSVSAFCNAGFDVMGKHSLFSSLVTYMDNPIILLTLAVLIIVGSTGFYVWEDVITRRRLKKLHVHSKLVLIITGILIILGMVMYLVFEHDNPGNIGEMSMGRKLLVTFFQSVSTRTAGFDVIGQSTLTEDTKVLSMLLMFIGGSSGSTAGGVKTVTIGILVLSAINNMRGKRELVVFERRIPHMQVINATTLVFISILTVLFGGIFISTVNDVNLINSLFEAIAAYSTAGMTIGLVKAVNPASQVMIIFFMFFGKIGLLSLSLGFITKSKKQTNYTYPEENVIVG